MLYSPQNSATLPCDKRNISMPVSVTLRPLAGTPNNSPLWVALAASGLRLREKDPTVLVTVVPGPFQQAVSSPDPASVHSPIAVE